MGNFIGTYEVKMDTKGRVRLPSALLRQIAESSRREFVLNRGFEGCISLFPIEEWKNVSEVVNSLSPFRKEDREFQRYFYRAATQVELDSNDRLLIGKSLQDFAELKDDIVIHAYANSIDIWSAIKYNEMINKEHEDFSDMADRVMTAALDKLKKN